MNAPINRLFWVIVVLFGLLVYFTSKSTVFQADALRNNALNRRGLLQAQKIDRGEIQASDGTVLARSVKDKNGDYVRRYPTDSIFSQAVGYSYLTPGRAGLERQYNDALTGQRGEFSSIIDQISGTKPAGDDLRTHLNPAAQQAALDGLAGRKGAVVALDPKTGQVLAMASEPGFDQNALATEKGTNALNGNPNAPLVNRATQGTYPPGSTFKVVTAIAAVDSGAYTPDSPVSGKSPLKVSGVPMSNDNDQSFGDISLTTALTYSVNTAFARIALKVGAPTIQMYMERLGFGKDPPLDYPSNQMVPSGEYVNGGKTLVKATDGRVDLGRLAIGQDKLLVTPLQMAMVASAVANKGVLMQPRLGDKVVDPDGRVRETIEPEQESRVMSAKSAAEVGQMMTKVVEEGTGTAAQLGALEGEVAGKTGTAQIDIQNGITQPWFIAFAPVDNPKVAVAVTVERTEGGFGGDVAAPIAKNVMETLLR
jgi:peptidoglycan glycosyltransferase